MPIDWGYKSRSTIAKIEKGVNDITQTTLVNIARALNTSPAYLMGWISEEKDKENTALAASAKMALDKSGIDKLKDAVSFVTGKPISDPEVEEFAEMFESLNPEQRASVKQFMAFIKNGK